MLLRLLLDESQALWQLAVYDTEIGQANSILPLHGHRGESGLSYDAQLAALYVPNGTGIMRFFMDGASQPVYGVPSMSPMASIRSGLFVGVRLGQLRVCQALEQPTGSISVMGHRTQYNLDFTQKTGIVVNERSVGERTSMQNMAEAMVTRDDHVDLYAFETSEGLQVIKDKGYYVDLSRSEVLCQGPDRLYPAFANAVTNDKRHIVAWPVIAMPFFSRALDPGALAYASRPRQPGMRCWT